jgi:long-chain acyl-CoA synthetase
MATLARMLTETVAATGTVALKLDELELPDTALDQASARVAGLLAARGIGPGDRVGLMMPNLPYSPFAFYGVAS